jgi:hypothetical protein
LLAAAVWPLAFGCHRDDAGAHGGAPSPTTEHGAVIAAGGPGRLGVPVRTDHYVITASAFQPCAPEKAADHRSERAADRTTLTERVGVELSIERTGLVQVPANPYYATLVDADDDVHEATLGGCGAPLEPALPAAGQTARGWVVFDVPEKGRTFTLFYAPELVEAADPPSGTSAPQREVAIALKR